MTNKFMEWVYQKGFRHELPRLRRRVLPMPDSKKVAGSAPNTAEGPSGPKRIEAEGTSRSETTNVAQLRTTRREGPSRIIKVLGHGDSSQHASFTPGESVCFPRVSAGSWGSPIGLYQNQGIFLRFAPRCPRSLCSGITIALVSWE